MKSRNLNLIVWLQERQKFRRRYEGLSLKLYQAAGTAVSLRYVFLPLLIFFQYHRPEKSVTLGPLSFFYPAIDSLMPDFMKAPGN